MADDVLGKAGGHAPDGVTMPAPDGDLHPAVAPSVVRGNAHGFIGERFRDLGSQIIDEGLRRIFPEEGEGNQKRLRHLCGGGGHGGEAGGGHQAQHRLQQKARQSGCIVIDNSRLYSGSAEAAVILPELNPYAVNDALAQKLAVPASSVTTELALPLALLHDEFGVARVQAAVLEAVSEHGRSGTETLARETAHLLNGMPADNSDFPAQLAFNLHTSIGKTQEDGTTDHEAAVLFELSKIFGPLTKGISLTCLQAPVFYGHTAVVQVELEEDPSVEEVAECLRRSPDIELVTDELLTPVTHGVRENCIYLSRLRRSAGVKRTFDLVLVMDNTRRGEALNCVEIAELIDKALHG